MTGNVCRIIRVWVHYNMWSWVSQKQKQKGFQCECGGLQQSGGGGALNTFCAINILSNSVESVSHTVSCKALLTACEWEYNHNPSSQCTEMFLEVKLIILLTKGVSALAPLHMIWHHFLLWGPKKSLLLTAECRSPTWPSASSFPLNRCITGPSCYGCRRSSLENSSPHIYIGSRCCNVNTKWRLTHVNTSFV